jgi:hypothetical protein
LTSGTHSYTERENESTKGIYRWKIAAAVGVLAIMAKCMPFVPILQICLKNSPNTIG